MTILGQPFFYSQLVVGAQYAQIERTGITGQSTVLQFSFIEFHQFGVNHVESQINSATERHETIEGSLIGFTGTDFPQLFFTLYLHLNKMKHTGILINKRIKM